MESRQRRMDLRRFLASYYDARQRRVVLEGRSRIGDPPEVIEAIEKQREATVAAMNDVIRVLDFLPNSSPERLVLELRHLDFKTWPEIERTLNLTRTPCINRYNKGLDFLLQIQEVQKIIDKN